MSEPTTEQIKRRAYEPWEQAGSPEGRDEEFYQRAEQELPITAIRLLAPPVHESFLPRAAARGGHVSTADYKANADD